MDEMQIPVNADLNFANAQLEAQKNELIAMVEELSFLQNKLRESETTLKNAQQIAHLGNWVFDPEFQQITFSDEMLRIFGLPLENKTMTSAYVKQRIHPDDLYRFEETVKKSLSTGTSYEIEYRIIRKDGEQRTVYSKGYIQRKKGSDTFFLEGITQDITERKQSEEALSHANKKLNMLSSITRHDVLNKLTALYQFLEISKELVAENPLLSQYTVKELEVTEAIQRQIEFTRYYQDIGVRAPEWRDVENIVGSAVMALRPEGISISTNVHAMELFADPLIEKVFYNLMENSIRHGDGVTSITITGSEDEQGLTILYQDNGVGISAGDKGKIFNKGFGKHTGLGLFLSKEILAITNIAIIENGEPGQGVRFVIFVPKGAYRSTEVL